ncbi:MAG: hypothetical protein K8W52_44795 [Deltaproteobacteria bacterium]|nr:hypothetical protein [Deltaproteobacteria bacterium]
MGRVAGIAVAIAIGGCSGGSAAKHEVEDRPRDATASDGAVSASDAVAGAPTAPAAPGTVTVKVTWPDAPAAVRTTGKPNACGVARRAPAVVGTLFGVPGAVVHVDASPASGDATAAFVIGDCRLAPTVAIARPKAAIAITSTDPRRHRVIVGQGGAIGDVMTWKTSVDRAGVELPWAGAEIAMPAGELGVVRLATVASNEEPSWLVVTDRAAAITDRDGLATLSLPAGHWRIDAWLPEAVAGAGQHVASTEVDVRAGETADATIALGQP